MEPKGWKTRSDGKCLWEDEPSQAVVNPKLPLLDDPSRQSPSGFRVGERPR